MRIIFCISNVKTELQVTWVFSPHFETVFSAITPKTILEFTLFLPEYFLSFIVTQP